MVKTSRDKRHRRCHNIHKYHSPPSQLVIPIKDISSIFHFNQIIKYDGKFRNGFHDPEDPPKIVSHITLLSTNHTTILCDKKLENGKIYEITFRIKKGMKMEKVVGQCLG